MSQPTNCDSRQHPVESTPTELNSSGNSLCFSLDEFPELHWIAQYTSAQTQLQQSIAALTSEIASLDREQPLDGGHIEQYQVNKNGKTYTYHRYRWYVGLTKAGNPKLKQTEAPQRSAQGAIRTTDGDRRAKATAGTTAAQAASAIGRIARISS